MAIAPSAEAEICPIIIAANRGEPELSFDILDRFRAALKTAGAPLASAIDPGLSDAQIDEVAAELGMAVPPELRTLWRWGCPSSTANVRQGG